MVNPIFGGIASKLRLSFLLGPCLAVVTSSAVAQAVPDGSPAAGANSSEIGPAPSKEQCVDWHRQSQLAQNNVKLVEARDLAQQCTAPTCPGPIINDCARWMNDLDQKLPSVVFEVRVDGEPDTTATVTADDKPVEQWKRGEALRLDPGEHQFRFELGEYAPIVRKLLLSEGMRFRVVSVDFKSASLQATPTATPPPPNEPPEPTAQRRIPPMVYPLAGVGAAGVLSFSVFALLGKSQQNDLEKCKPNCPSSDVSSMKTKYLVGDISLGIGLASLVAAGVFYFSMEGQSTPTATIGLTHLPGGGAALATVRF
jgi:hypothetical protein